MKYVIEHIEARQSGKGNAYQMVTLKGEDGNHVEASTFDLAGKAVGETVEGSIIVNGKFTNFKASMPPRPAGLAKAGAGVAKAMERKENSIAKFQDSKETSIRLTGAMRDAVQLAIAELEGKDKTPMASRIMHWRSWLLEHYGDETDIKSPF